jgi:uncharacterized protein (TIGR03086 family)
MDKVAALQRSYEKTEKLLANITPADLDKPTPCTEWDVRALLGHYVNVVKQFPALLRDEEPDWSAQPPLDDPAAEFDAAVRENLEAWEAPGAAQSPSKLMADMKSIDFNLADAVLHTWDLAQALGQDPDLDEDSVRVVYATWRDADLDTARKYGAFGPAVPEPSPASTLDQLLALTGRTPG